MEAPFVWKWLNCVNMLDQERLLSSLKKEVRSLLTAVKNGLTPGELEKEYRSMIGERLPFRALGYQSTMELVMDMPDVVNICRGGDGSVVLKAIADESTRGIARLVARQRSETKSQLSRLRSRPKISPGYASRLGRPLQTQMPQSLPRRGRVPPTLPAAIKSQLKELLRPSPVLLSDFNKAFARHFGRNFECVHYGFFSMSEMLNAASDIITVVQTRAGSLLTLKQSPSLKEKMEKLPQTKVVIQPDNVKQTLPPVGSAPRVDTCSPASNQPTLSSLPTHYQNQTPSQQSDTSLVQSKPEEIPLVKYNKMKQLQQQMKTVLAQRGPGGTLSSELKEKIKTVVAQHQEGLLVSRLPGAFEAHFKEKLPLRELGFLTLMELVGALSDVLRIECKEGEQDWRVFDVDSHCFADDKKTEDDDDTNQETSLSGSLAHEEASDKHELPSWDFPSEGSKHLEAKLNVVTKIVKPHLGLEEPHIMQEIMEKEIPPDAVQDRRLYHLPQLESAALVGLSVEYVVSPSQFYVQISAAETSEKLEDMMIEMRRCYASRNVADRYVMPEASVKPGHLCCVKNLQDKWWYRGVIHCVLSDQEVEVFYPDFGNMEIVPNSHLRFLKDCYANLPAQAIPCCLAQMKPAKGDWTSGAILEFQRLCGFKLLVGVVDEYIDGVLHLFLCDTSSDEDIYFHDVLRLGGHAVICRENIPSKGFRELNPSTLYLMPSPKQKVGLKEADAVSFLQGLPGTASPEPCRNENDSQRCGEEKEDLACLKPERQVQGHGCLDVSAKKSCDCQARDPCKDSPENQRLVPKDQSSQAKVQNEGVSSLKKNVIHPGDQGCLCAESMPETRQIRVQIICSLQDTASPCSVPEVPYLEPVCLCTEIWDEDWIPLLSIGEEGRTCNNLCSDIAVFSGQTHINGVRNETRHSQELEQQATDPLGSAIDCLSQEFEEFYISIVNSQQSTDLSRMALDAKKAFACNSQPLPELSVIPVDGCNGEAPSKKKENNAASGTQLVALLPSPCSVHGETGHSNALVFTAELQGSPVFFIPYSPSAALGASARLATSGGYFSLSQRKMHL